MPRQRYKDQLLRSAPSNDISSALLASVSCFVSPQQSQNELAKQTLVSQHVLTVPETPLHSCDMITSNVALVAPNQVATSKSAPIKYNDASVRRVNQQHSSQQQHRRVAYLHQASLSSDQHHLVSSVSSSQIVNSGSIAGCSNVLTAKPSLALSSLSPQPKFMDLGKKLLEASREGKIENVRQLTNSGAPFAADCLGTTSLHLAAMNGHMETAQILLKAGVNLDARTKLDRTALHIAAQEGRVEMVELLLSHGADINARDMLKMTPLHWSVERRHVKLVKYLLNSGADVNACNKFILTPLEIAQYNNYHEIIVLFETWARNLDLSLGDSYVPPPTAHQQQHNHIQEQTAHLQIQQPVSLDHFRTFPQTTTNSSSRSSGEGGNTIAFHPDFSVQNLDSNSPSQSSILDLNESCMDLIDIEWHSIKLEPDLLLQTKREEERDVQYLMKVVDDLQKENSQLRQRVEQLSST